MLKSNCWEVKRCERQPGGMKVMELGVCPAAIEPRLDGIHGGKNAGRTCWVTAGTLCGGKVQGTFAKKYETCKTCAFYLKVQQEEGGTFKLSANLLAMLSR